MAYVAFTYYDYGTPGIKNNFRGYFDDDREVFKIIHGDRSDQQNLEIMNLETLAIEKYRWISDWQSKGRDEEGNDMMVHRWKKDLKPIRAYEDGDGVPEYGLGTWTSEGHYDDGED